MSCIPAITEALTAMGFNRHWIDETNAPDLFERRHQTLDDMTTVTGVAFLGMTFGCARCHDHKFDPILTKDYYRLQAFFANTTFGDGPLPLADPEAKRKYDEQYAAWDAKTKDIRDEMAKIMAPILEDRKKHSATVMTDEVQAVVAKDAALRTPLEQQVYHIAETRFGGLGDPVRALKGDQAKRYAELKTQLASFDSLKPAPLPEGQFMTDLNATAPPTHILRGGSRLAEGDEVQPGFLSILDPSDAKITQPAGAQLHRPPQRAGGMAHRSFESAALARDGESHLALSFRTRHRSHAGRSGHDGRAAHASGAAGLSGQLFRRQRLEHQEGASPDSAFERLSGSFGL